MPSPSQRRDSGAGAAGAGAQLPLLMDRPDTSLRIHASNRLETLAERLADEIRRHPAAPLEPERIVVPDALLGQWLRLELASRLGVAAHLKVEQQAEFAWAAMRNEIRELTGESVYGPPYLRWRIFDRLRDWTGDDEIGTYLQDGDARKRFELADQLAVAYDRCRVYRPQAIRAWQGGAADGWHARLWAELAAADGQPQHWVDAIDRYRDVLAARGRGPAAAAPRRRVSYFHVAELSPTYVEVLRLAASVMDIHLYLLSPSRRFWTGADAPQGKGDDEHVHTNELLEAWSRSARDLREQLLADRDAAVVVSRPASGDTPRGATCLAAVQRDILGVDAAADAERREPAGPDESIQVHVCHSPSREVEVLHDRLLHLFDRQPDIQPADVLILTPDLDTYAPRIEAVFGSANRIGFSIGARRLKEGEALTAFLDLLDLPGSRYTASAMLAPLLAESVRSCFGIPDNDLATIRGAAVRSGVRWGLDGEHRTDLGVPSSENHNWRRGLDRLLLGYAMHEGDTLIDGVTPSALDPWGFHTGAADYELLGRLHRYAELVFELNGWMEAEHDANGWTDRLRKDILDRFFSTRFHAGPEAVREVNTVFRLIDEFAEECRRGGSTGPIAFPVLRDVLKSLAAKSARNAPNLADGVTVAALASGQIFPARVICAIGMNDTTFPRRPAFAPFDFQARLFEGEAKQPGDRDRRQEDRFAFLEALLAARRCFLLTYTGRDIQEDKPIPPSVVVSELTDHLRHRFRAWPPEQQDRWETRHPLQPFSRRYFQEDEPSLFSYSRSMLEAARALQTHGEVPRRFEGALAAEPGGDVQPELELEDLIRFSTSPSLDFLRRRLGISLDPREDEVADDEPLDLNALEAWQLKSNLTTTDEEDDERTIELAAARGLLPGGNLGRVHFRQSQDHVEELDRALDPFREHLQTSPCGVDIDLGDVRLVGAVEQFHPEKRELLFWRVGSLGARYRIATWLRLLALSCDRDMTATARLLGSGRQGKEIDDVLLKGPDPATARSLLGEWTELWQESERRPLPLFASTSWAWLRKARWDSNVERMWSGQSYSEGNQAGHRLLFPSSPESEEFEALANRLLGPLKDATVDDS